MVLLWASFLIGLAVTVADEFWTNTDIPELQQMPEMKWFLWIGIPITYGFFFALIYFISKRKNWARIVLAVFELVGIVAVAWMWSEGYESDVSWGETGLMMLDLLALYWLFTGAGARWFKEKPA